MIIQNLSIINSVFKKPKKDFKAEKSCANCSKI